MGRFETVEVDLGWKAIRQAIVSLDGATVEAGFFDNAVHASSEPMA